MKKSILALTALMLLAVFSSCMASNPVVTPRTGGGGGSDLDAAVNGAAALMETKIPAGTRVALVSVASPETALSEQVLTRLESAIARGGRLVVVGRANLDKLRAELGVQLSGEVDNRSASSIANILGAGVMVTGSLTDLGDAYSLNLTATNMATNIIAVSYLADLEKSALEKSALGETAQKFPLFWIIVVLGAIVIVVIAVIVSRSIKAEDATKKREIEQGKLLRKELLAQGAAGDAAAAKKYADYAGYFNQGVAFYNQKNYSNAAECFGKAIGVLPFFDAEAYFLRGVCFLWIKAGGLYAYDDFKTVMMIDPNNKRYRETFFTYRKRFFYLGFLVIMKIVLKIVGPLIAGFIGGKIGMGKHDELLRLIRDGASVADVGGYGTLFVAMLRTVGGAVLGMGVSWWLGGLLFIRLGLIGNEKFGMTLDITELMEEGMDAADGF